METRTQRHVDEERSIAILSRIARDVREEPATRMAALKALATYMPQMDVVNALSDVLSREGERSDVRQAAVFALGRKTPP